VEKKDPVQASRLRGTGVPLKRVRGLFKICGVFQLPTFSFPIFAVEILGQSPKVGLFPIRHIPETPIQSMTSAGPEAPLDRLHRFLPSWLLSWAAVLAWAGAILGLAGRAILSPERATNTARFLRAGEDWIKGEPLYIYTPNKGFVYSPLAAVCYAATTWLPTVLANVFWMFISAGLLLAGLWVMLNKGPFRHIPQRFHALVYLLVFPLSLGNIDSAQANPIVIGFVMLAVGAANLGRWALAAAAVTAAVYWKVYPLAVGLLLVLVAPQKFSWKLALFLIIGGLLPFLFQKTGYVSSQYWLWYDTRISDNRLNYNLSVAPLDLWFVLVRFAGLPLNDLLYRLIQMGGAAILALLCIYGGIAKWSLDRLLGALFCFVCIWMTLLGPASELHAYLLLAPAVAMAVVESFSRNSSATLRVLSLVAYSLLLLAILRVGFIPQYRELWILTLQPIAAILFMVYSMLRYLPSREWAPSVSPS